MEVTRKEEERERKIEEQKRKISRGRREGGRKEEEVEGWREGHWDKHNPHELPEMPSQGTEPWKPPHSLTRRPGTQGLSGRPHCALRHRHDKSMPPSQPRLGVAFPSLIGIRG